MNRYLIRNSIRFYSSFFGLEILKYFRTFLSVMWCSPQNQQGRFHEEGICQLQSNKSASYMASNRNTHIEKRIV